MVLLKFNWYLSKYLNNIMINDCLIFCLILIFIHVIFCRYYDPYIIAWSLLLEINNLSEFTKNKHSFIKN